MRYSLDSDAIINAWRYYPIDLFPSVWTWLELIGKDNIAGMSEIVFGELAIGGDECFEWFKKRKKLFVHPNIDPVQREVRRLVTTYNNFGIHPGKNGGDPYVIALAIVNETAVVTNESPSGNMNGPKIPDICLEEEIPLIRFVNMIRNEGAIF